MAELDDEFPDLVEGRPCGDCNVCCVALTIDEPTLQKVQGYRCRNARADNSCKIYPDRPRTCRTFFCGWRRLSWIKGPLRPDVSGVLVRLHHEVSRESGARRTGVIFTLLNHTALKAEGLAESVAAAVAAGVPTYLHIPGRPGYTSSQARINEALTPAVLAKDKEAVLGILREARTMGRAGAHRRIVLGGKAASQAGGDGSDPPAGRSSHRRG